MGKNSKLLFNAGFLSEALSYQLNQVSSKVDAILENQLLSISEDDLIEHIYSEMSIEPIELHEQAKEMEQHETKVDVSGDPMRGVFGRGPFYVAGVEVVVSIPYTGEYKLWELRPNHGLNNAPHSAVVPPKPDGIGYLYIVMQQPIDRPKEKIKEYIDHELMLIRHYIDSQKTQIVMFNSSLSEKIRELIKARKGRLEIQDGIADFLGIPLKRRSDIPLMERIPIKKKLVKPLPSLANKGVKSEPGIDDKDYEYILSVIRHEGRTYETTPKTYEVHDEEELRDIMLAHLNGHYEGGATGETFRRSGKTDIRIEDHDRAAFVAECKIWKGKKELLDALEQLLGYLTWKDCKSAIIIFNKHNAKFTELLEKVPEVLRSHQHFVKDSIQSRAGEWRFIFKSLEDELRHVIVHVFIFNLYVLK